MDTGDNDSSLYMQLDKIPVAVQQLPSQSSSAYMVAFNLKRKALKDISNQAYRHIIHSLQELAQMSSDEGEPAAQSVAGDNETRTLAEATLLPMNRKSVETFYCLHINMPHKNVLVSSVGMEIRRNSVRQGSVATDADSQVKPAPAMQQVDGVASFTNVPPTAGDLHRPRAVRHPSPSSESQPVDLLNSLTSSVVLGSRNGLPIPNPFNRTSSPLKNACHHHTSTGQHLHQQYGHVRSLANELPESVSQSSAQNGSSKKSRANKQVTFPTEARLIGEAGITLPVVFESDQEDSVSYDPADSDETLMSGFVNVPCSRRGFCLELDSADPVGDSEQH